MLIFPAIDLYGGKAVRLYKGDYKQMTVYSEDPLSVARDFERAGATCIHLVDLEGAKDGTTPNIDIVRAIARETSLFCEIGGGIRNMEIVDAYLSAGVDRVILGTAEGEFSESTSDEEEIECRWYTREEVRRLIREEAFSARVQMFCYFWSHADRT